MSYFYENDKEEDAKLIALVTNRTMILRDLLTLNIDKVTACYDGYGDGGQIEDWTVENTDGIVFNDTGELQAETTIRTVVPRDTHRFEMVNVSLAEAMEEYCYDILKHDQPGWEINDGSHGEFVFNVKLGTISLEHNRRYTDIVTTTAEY